MNTTKPYSEACDQNKDPILNVIKTVFQNATCVLEVGSGTGQHAAYFAQHLPHLTWQTSDVIAHHSGIQSWLNSAQLKNTPAPLALDVSQKTWPSVTCDGVFSANTTHIMSWPEVEDFFAGVAGLLPTQGNFCLYGPFNLNQQFTSESNARFEQWLKSRDPLSGIRDQGDLMTLGAQHGLSLQSEFEMPANNKILIWQKQ